MLNFDWTKRTHKGLRKWILHIVREGPKSGVEIMNVMESSLQGWWRPSPGSIYPMLDKMRKEGVLDRSKDDKYSLTQLGKDEVERPWPWFEGSPSPPRTIEGTLTEISSYISYLEDISRTDGKAMTNSGAELRSLGERLTRLGEK